MPRKCTICSHDQRDEIDAALVAGESYRTIASRFDVSTAALQRHKTTHLLSSLVQAQNASEAARGDRLLEQVDTLRAQALQILTRAEESGELRTALAAIREARGCLELLARLMGELQDGTRVNITISPQWVQLRGQILLALAPFPGARTAVIQAIGGSVDDQ